MSSLQNESFGIVRHWMQRIVRRIIAAKIIYFSEHCPRPAAISPRYTRPMDRLWTPWRYSYITHADPQARTGVPAALNAWPPSEAEDKHCVFCNMIAAVDYAIAHGMPRETAEQAVHIVHRGAHCFICLNAYPYTTGHVMIVPYQHLGLARRRSRRRGQRADASRPARRTRPARGLQPEWPQHGTQPRRSCRRRHRRPHSPARPSAMDRRHKFHDSYRRNPCTS